MSILAVAGGHGRKQLRIGVCAAAILVAGWTGLASASAAERVPAEPGLTCTASYAGGNNPLPVKCEMKGDDIKEMKWSYNGPVGSRLTFHGPHDGVYSTKNANSPTEGHWLGAKGSGKFTCTIVTSDGPGDLTCTLVPEK